jgi:hypothetical protein
MGSEHHVDDSRDGLGKTIWQAVERITQLEEAVTVLGKSGHDMAVLIETYGLVDETKPETVTACVLAAAKCHESMNAVVNNPIAAEAVRKAGG